MKKAVFIAWLFLPALAWAQLETVVQPQAVPSSNYAVTDSNINYALTNQNPVRELPEGDLDVTTPYGTATIERAQTNTTQEPTNNLDDVVAQINADFEIAQQSCTTGSWLGNIWCRVGGWF